MQCFLDWTGWTWVGWQGVAAIATGVLAGGIVFAILQVRQARKGTNAQLAVELFKELRSEETKNILRFIYQLDRDKIQFLPDTEKHAIDGLLDKFELLGTLVDKGIIDRRLAIEAYAGPPALRCWHQLVLYIKGERKRRGFFLKNYEYFSECSFKHFKDKEVKIAFYDKGIPDLVAKFQEKGYRHPPGKLDDIIRPKTEKKVKVKAKGEV
jgi:hypothetical protein